MEIGFFTNLPNEMTTNILGRLPARTIMSCKCVCKPWLSLLQSKEFAKSHLSKPTSGLAINGVDSYKIYEFDDVLDLERHESRYIPVTEFKSTEFGFSDSAAILGSANGLLLLFNPCNGAPDELYVVNPLTNECITLSSGKELIRGANDVAIVYGFGATASKTNSKFKVVRISLDCVRDEVTDEILSIMKSDCRVYTLGTASWRSITPGPLMEYDYCSYGAFTSGNLHWLVYDLNSLPYISCFDLEDEQFSTFPAPPSLSGNYRAFPMLHAMENGLCVSDNASDDQFVGWLLKDYGGSNSWSKEFVINKALTPNFFVPGNDFVCPIKVFENGDILMTWDQMIFFYISGKNKTAHEVRIIDRNVTGDPILHTSSFLSLKEFVEENVTYRNM